LTVEAAGVGNVLAEAVKGCLHGSSHRADPLFSYLQGKLDAKWLVQRCLVALRGEGILAQLNPHYQLSRDVGLQRALMGWQRLKVTNWHVCGLINVVHRERDLRKPRDLDLTEEKKMYAAMSAMLQRAPDDGTMTRALMVGAMKTRAGLKDLGTVPGCLPVLEALQRCNVIRTVEHAGAQVDDAPEMKLALLGAGTRSRLSTVTLKRTRDGTIDRNARQALEREGLSLLEPDPPSQQ